MSVDILGDLPSNHTPIWHYMKFSTLLLLLEGKAYFPSVAKLSATDPLEGQLRISPIALGGQLSRLAEPGHSNHLDDCYSKEPHFGKPAIGGWKPHSGTSRPKTYNSCRPPRRRPDRRPTMALGATGKAE